MKTYRKSLWLSFIMFATAIPYAWISYIMIDSMYGPLSWPVFSFIMFGVVFSPSAFLSGVFLLLIGLSQRAQIKGPLWDELSDKVYSAIYPALRWLDRSSK